MGVVPSFPAEKQQVKAWSFLETTILRNTIFRPAMATPRGILRGLPIALV